MYLGRTIITVSGHGGSGKSTTAKWLSQNTAFAYNKPTSWYAAEKIFQEITSGNSPNFPPDAYPNVEACWLDRLNHREYWAAWIRQYNQTHIGGIQLYHDAIADRNYILDGIRKKEEFLACKAAGLVDFAIWLENPNVERDPTMDYDYRECDIVIHNDSDKASLFHKLARMFKTLDRYGV